MFDTKSNCMLNSPESAKNDVNAIVKILSRIKCNKITDDHLPFASAVMSALTLKDKELAVLY